MCKYEFGVLYKVCVKVAPETNKSGMWGNGPSVARSPSAAQQLQPHHLKGGFLGGNRAWNVRPASWCGPPNGDIGYLPPQDYVAKSRTMHSVSKWRLDRYHAIQQV